MGYISLLLCAGAVLWAPFFVHGQVVITEIMYDLPSGSDSGREWIEVYNASASPVDITKLRLFENGTNHKITASAGQGQLAPASYAVIADNSINFKTDWPTYSELLFDSVFSLSNDGETIGLRDASSTEIATVSYTNGWGAAGDGNSLNRSPQEPGAFSPHSPSPGQSMSSTVIRPIPKAVPVAVAKKTKPAAVSKNAGPEVTDVRTDAPDPTDVTQFAAAASAPPSSYQWWLATFALALATCATIFVARRYAKTEWNIVEE